MSPDDYILRGKILRVLAAYHASPFNDGTLCMGVGSIANACGDEDGVRRICEAEVGNVLERGTCVTTTTVPAGGERGYRLSSVWLLKQMIARQDRDVADVALGRSV